MAPSALRYRVLGIVALLLLHGVSPAQAQDAQSALLLLRPHCEQGPDTENEPLGPLPDLDELAELGSGRCAQYSIRDPQTQTTETLRAGDTLDMDLVLANLNRQPIAAVRAWLSYDPRYLEGLTIEMNARFPSITPGEADFDASTGTVRIGVASDTGREPTGSLLPVARIRFRVKEAPPAGSTPIMFQDSQEGTDGHTYATSKLESARNILPLALGTLLVMIQGEGNSQATSSAASLPAVDSVESSSSVSATERSSFVLLQVQNVRATTDKGGSTIYVAWERLRSSELAGYNLYYGTERGRYIQRHSVTPESTSAAIRGLVPGTTYFVAVRGVNGQNEETAFSREVSITVGDPSSSTSPMTVRPTGGPAGQNPLRQPGQGTSTVPGESGASSLLALLLLASGVIGTLFAFRRQLIAAPSHARH